MFNILLRFKHTGRFIFTPDDRLSSVCNAPKDRSGVYLIKDTSNEESKLLYIGCSGKIKNGELVHRKGGLYDRLVKGKQFGKARRKSWVEKMNEEKISALTVFWYDTGSSDPEEIEDRLLSEVIITFGALPPWNSKGPKILFDTP